MKNRIISLLLCIVMLICFLPAGLFNITANAENTDNPFNICYNAEKGRIEFEKQNTDSYTTSYYDVKVYFDWHNGEYNKQGTHPEAPADDAYEGYNSIYGNYLFTVPVSNLTADTLYVMRWVSDRYFDGYCYHNGEKVYEQWSTSDLYNPTGIYKSVYGGMASIRGWYRICVTLRGYDKYTNLTETTSTADVWVDKSIDDYPSPLCNVHIETINGEQFLCWDPIKNGGRVGISVKGTSLNEKTYESLYYINLDAGQTKTSLKPLQEEADKNSAGWENFSFDVVCFSKDGTFYIGTEAIDETTFSAEAVYGKEKMDWNAYEDGFTVTWQEYDTKELEYGNKKLKLEKAELRLIRFDKRKNKSIRVMTKEISAADGVISAGDYDFSSEILKNGDGIYFVRVECYFKNAPILTAMGTQTRLFQMSDYLQFTSQFPAQGETVKAEKGSKLNYSYTVADIPQWMKNAGVTLFSDYTYLYVDGDTENELNSTLSNVSGDTDGLSWKGSANLNNTGTHTLFYRVRAKVGDDWYNIDSSLQGKAYIEVNEKPKPETVYSFTKQPTDITVQNQVSPTISWSTNTAAPTVGIEQYSDENNQWMNVSSSLGRNASEGTYTIASRNNTYKHTRQKYRLYIKTSVNGGYKYTYSDVFTVTWTNDGKVPSIVTLPSVTLPNGETYSVTVPFNYGSTGSTDKTYSTRYKVFLLNEDGTIKGSIGSSASCSSSKGTSITVKVFGDSWENSTQHFLLTIYNSSNSSDANNKGIPTQNVYFDITWEDICKHDNTHVENKEDATCLFSGYTGDTYCTDCGKLLSAGETISELSHSYKGAVKDNKDGTHSFKCVNGCDTYGGTVKCTWNAGKVTKASTTTEEGIKTYTCTVCKGTKTEKIDMLTEENFLLGDIDNDKKVTAADARLALRASVGLECYEASTRAFKTANVDNDEKITAADARLILRASVGLEDLNKKK